MSKSSDGIPDPIKDVQHGGSHYKSMKIQPVEYAHANGIGPLEFEAIKYLSRHGRKGKAEDVKKALHFCQMLLRLEYGIDSQVSFPEEKKSEESVPTSPPAQNRSPSYTE